MDNSPVDGNNLQELPDYKNLSNQELNQMLRDHGVAVEVPVSDFTRSIMVNKLLKLFRHETTPNSANIAVNTTEPHKVSTQPALKDILFGINLSGVEEQDASLSDLYFCESKEELTAILSKYKNVRFIVCKNKEEAREFNLQRLTNSTQKPAPEADPSDYSTPKQQDLNQLKLAIEKQDSNRLEQLIASNPKLLVTSSDVPTILQIRCHYNALHVAATCDNATAAKLVIRHLSSEELWQLLYPRDPNSVRSSRRTICLSSYLNTGDALLGETPLHFACKFGSGKVAPVLLAQPAIEIDKPNKEGEIPFQVICTRKFPERKRHIQNLFSENYFVPVYRSPDNTTPPILGRPVHRHSDRMVSMDREEREGTPIKEQLLCRAWAGPLNEEKANKFYKEWKSPPGMKSPLAAKNSRDRRRDPEKGLECDGRALARNFNVGWCEYWEFLGKDCNLTEDEGKQLLEEYLLQRSSKFSKEGELETEFKKLLLSPQQVFLHGDTPTKADHKAVDALGEDIDIDRNKYPAIFQWKKLVREYCGEQKSDITEEPLEQSKQPSKRTLLKEFNKI